MMEGSGKNRRARDRRVAGWPSGLGIILVIVLVGVGVWGCEGSDGAGGSEVSGGSEASATGGSEVVETAETTIDGSVPAASAGSEAEAGASDRGDGQALAPGSHTADGDSATSSDDAHAALPPRTPDSLGAAGASAADSANAAPPPDPPSFTRPEHVRGIYLNAWASGSSLRTAELIELARRTEINTFVIDVKDDTGYLSYPTRVELAHEIGADQEIRIRDVRGLLRRLEEEGIYPIARIVVFKDHLLAKSREDMAIQDSAGGAWVDGRGDIWVNPYDERVWEYHAEIAREAAELGFPEIQWDYVRFPDRPASELERAVFPGRADRIRAQAIREFLMWSEAELADLDVPLTADVFGMSTSARSDVGIGQLWEEFIDVVDAALPMIYPSHYWEGSFGIDEPNAHPYEVVAAALRDAVRRNEAIENPGRVIPWLQDFTLGSPRYEAAEVRAQILATYDAGIHEWILWNSAGRYTEAALEPVGGWDELSAPSIRYGGEVVRPEVRFLPAEEPVLEAPEPMLFDSMQGDTAGVARGGGSHR